jgi:metal-sulfur cluster biosynthetic enzyme
MPATIELTEARVLQSLAGVVDPELGMSIVDLGLVYDVRIDGARVTVTMTLTAPGCPLRETMAEWARAAVAAIPGVERVDVAITFDPPWTPARMRR